MAGQLGTNAPIRVGIVGAGRRVREMYLPVLDALGSEFAVAGIVARTADHAASLASERGTSHYRRIADLATQGGAELIIVAVNAQVNADVALEAMETGRAVLMETPIGLTPASGRRVVRHAVRRSVPVGVAEQKPFLPFECFKRQLIASGVLGRVLVADNDFRSLDYHAMAQLRLVLNRTARPTSAQATRLVTTLEAAGHPDESGPVQEIWTIGSVLFDDGSIATHRSTSAYSRAPVRTFRSLRVYGTRGSIVNGDVTSLDDRGRAVDVDVRYVGGAIGGAPNRIIGLLPDGGEVMWDNPCPSRGLTDDQVGLAQHLIAMRRALRGSGSVLYGLHDAMLDVDLVDALAQSATKGGVPVGVAHRCADPACRPMPRTAVASRQLVALGRRVAGSGLVRGVRSRARERERRSR